MEISITKGRTIENLAPNYKKIILDTSTLEATNALPHLKKIYGRSLRRTGQANKNIYTTDEVFRESKQFITNPKAIGIKKINPESYEPFFSTFLDYLKPRALEFGLVADEDSLNTDLNLAAIIFSISSKGQEKVMFSSSDRDLLDFIVSRTTH